MIKEKQAPVEAISKLGLPPMALAESARNGSNITRWILPLIQKVITMMLLLAFGAGTYILLIHFFKHNEITHNSEIILVTEIEPFEGNPNITIQDDMNIVILVENKTLVPNNNRTKRHTVNAKENADDPEKILAFNEFQLQMAKEMINQHDLLCQQDSHEEGCQTLIKKLKSIAETKQSTNSNSDSVEIDSKPDFDMNKKNKKNYIKDTTNVLKSDALKKREVIPVGQIQNIIESTPPIESREAYGYPYTNPANIISSHRHLPLSPLTDTCLLARLLKHSYPHTRGIYDSTNVDYSAPLYEHSSSPHTRYYPAIPSQAYIQGRDVETKKTKLHPQDVDIFMSFLTPKPDIPSVRSANLTTTSDAECILGTIPCDSESLCISEEQWCDGNVDCPDASDETRCPCKSRVDKSRLCDGYFDCPFGEDEMGCFGCQENAFSCDNVDMNSHSICFTKEQRCDNIFDCPNRRDEMECIMLAPGLLKKSSFAISNAEGYLHRNFKGDWYPVCKNPYMWAHDTCRRETGLMIRPPYIEVLQIDPLLKVNYINTGSGNFMHITDNCFNSSAVYVTCPDLLCGTRELSDSQLLIENDDDEERLFGRNKRFLLSGHPYPFVFYGQRRRRQIDIDMREQLDNYYNRESMYQKVFDYLRNKRTQSRVVGGRPSLPAAWPWMVAVYRDGMFHCGGVVVTQNWVMSAAHCVHKFWDHYYEIQVGMLRRFSFSPQEHNHKVTHIIVNQHYKQEDMKNDLSLLRVEPVIQFSRWVRPICLPGPDTAGSDWLNGPSPGKTCIAVGWGAVVEHGADPDHMREVEVPIWDHCNHREDRAGKEICAGSVEGGKDACQGDSGGPLLCRNPLNSQQWYIAGIVSHGDGCARKDEPGVYTRVSLFVKWIRYHISSKSLPIVMPIQECPGFKCKSGFTKCIPYKRKCDKIIDCLNAEDEVECDNLKSANNLSENSMFLNEMFKSNDNISSIEKNRKAKNTANDIIEKNNTVINIETTEMFLKINDSDSTNMPITKQTELSKDQITKNTLINESILKSNESIEPSEIDYAHASTLEMPSMSESEELANNLVTTTRQSNKKSEIDLETVTMSFSRGSLELRSSVKEILDKKENNLNQNISEHDKLHESEITTNQPLFLVNTENITDVTNENFFTTHINLNQDISLFIENSQNILLNITNDITEDGFEEGNTETVISNGINNDKLDDNNEQQTGSKNFVSSYIDQENHATTLVNFVNRSKINENFRGSELELAKKIKEHRIPKEFECRRILQIIPYSQRCNHKADCEDGTDELNCTCVDYLSTIDVNLLCNGFSDCYDGQDETDCYYCAEDHFLCKSSTTCIPMKYVCDGKSNCPNGEDELDCYALTNGKQLQYDISKRPKLNIEGYVTKRYENEWHVVCDDKLTLQEIEESATYVCHYLGFSSPNTYFIRYINIKDDQSLESSEEMMRKKRAVDEEVPVRFSYTDTKVLNKTNKRTFINNPQIVEEICVPNVTRTCKSLYVICERTLFTDFNTTGDISFPHKNNTVSNNFMWPWIAKVYVEGNYKCTGVLVDLSWVIINHSCLWDTSHHNFISVVLGSHRTLGTINGLYEQVYQVDAKKHLYRSKINLLHLKKPAKYSHMVKPMVVSNLYYQTEKPHTCVAIGEDENNVTINIFLEETNNNCNSHNICFKRKNKDNICLNNTISKRIWAGIISCHSEQGWRPTASFTDSRGECGIGDHINATDIENLKQEIKFYSKIEVFPDSMELGDNSCEGVRCGRGRCVDMFHLCDGIQHCENGIDESEEACLKKHITCEKEQHHKGCGCTAGEMKCRNGKCISKELFRDGQDDCGDGTDEPTDTACSDYLARVIPSRLCDGIIHCHDRSDEDPMFCKCHSKRIYRCGKIALDGERCIATDMVCDNIRDCPGGDDEETCIGLSAPVGTPYGTGQVMIRSHGVWFSKCYSSPNHTKSELEAICRELGFLSGHAKEIANMESHPHNSLVLHPFTEVLLNNNTVLRMRNTDEPVAKPVFNENLKDCYPVFIECV